MKDIIIIGAGGHGAELDDYIYSSQKNSGKKGGKGTTVYHFR